MKQNKTGQTPEEKQSSWLGGKQTTSGCKEVDLGTQVGYSISQVNALGMAEYFFCSKSTGRNQTQKSFLKNKLQVLPNTRKRPAYSFQGYKQLRCQTERDCIVPFSSVNSQCFVTTQKIAVYNCFQVETSFLNPHNQWLFSMRKTQLSGIFISIYIFGFCVNVAKHHYAHLSMHLH